MVQELAERYKDKIVSVKVDVDVAHVSAMLALTLYLQYKVVHTQASMEKKQKWRLFVYTLALHLMQSEIPKDSKNIVNYFCLKIFRVCLL